MTEVSASNETRLPRAVRAQIKRIDARLETKPPGEDPPPQPPASVQPPASETPPAVTEPVDPPSGTPPADPRHADPLYWKQRFQVIEGIQRTERERHAGELERRDQQLDEMRERVRALERQAPTAAKDLRSEFFTPEQIEQFGDEQCEAMAQAAVKAARSQAQAAIDAEVTPIRERAQRQEQATAMTKRQELEEKLAEQVPDWMAVDKTPEWLEWLAQVDPGSSMVRQDILNAHLRSLKADAVAGMFKAFKASTAPPAPPVAPSRGPGGGGGEPPPPAVGAGQGYPTKDEIRDYSKRAATIRNPRDPRYVTDKERAEFEARLRLPRPGA